MPVSTGILLSDPLGKEDKTQSNTLGLWILMAYIRDRLIQQCLHLLFFETRFSFNFSAHTYLAVLWQHEGFCSFDCNWSVHQKWLAPLGVISLDIVHYSVCESWLTLFGEAWSLSKQNPDMVLSDSASNSSWVVLRHSQSSCETYSLQLVLRLSPGVLRVGRPQKAFKKVPTSCQKAIGIPTQQMSTPIWYLRLWRGAGERPKMSSFHLYQGESFLKQETTGEKCLLCLVNQKLPSWERKICSVLFFTTTILKAQMFAFPQRFHSCRSFIK